MPHGFAAPWVKETSQREKVVLIGWGYGSDSTKIPREGLLKGYLASLRPGAILLFHDGEGDHSKTLWLAERVLAELKKRVSSPCASTSCWRTNAVTAVLLSLLLSMRAPSRVRI